MPRRGGCVPFGAEGQNRFSSKVVAKAAFWLCQAQLWALG
jgi:hypothetical protein